MATATTAPPTLPVLPTLDDPAAADPAVAGAKAAALARARAAGLPVLPGVVVPVAIGRPAADAALAALSAGGSGAARLAVLEHGVPDPVVEAVADAVRAAGWSRLIVRSSAVVEDVGIWSGAFSTFTDVMPDEAAIAVRGVWASPFGVHTLERAEQAGTDPGEVAMAVLVQPMRDLHGGGRAEVQADGGVRLTATTGHLGDLMAGWGSGVEVRVRPDGAVEGGVDGLATPVLAAAADLARRTAAALDHEVIEWGADDGGVWLLQSGRRAVRTAAPASAAPLVGQGAAPVARLLAVLPGPLAEELVLPWALGAPDVVAGLVRHVLALPAPAPAGGPVGLEEDLARLRHLGDQMLRQVHGQRPDRARADAGALLQALRAGEDGVLDRIAGLGRPDPSVAAEAVEVLAGLVGRACRAGVARSTREVLSLSGAALRARLAGTGPEGVVDRVPPDRWEPVLHRLAVGAGEVVEGTGVGAGTAAGPVLRVTSLADPPAPRARHVVLVDRPVPAVAPLLWNAAALVAAGGSAGAHLLEVAGALNIPAVVACGLRPGDVGEGAVLAVDGGSGQVWQVPEGAMAS